MMKKILFKISCSLIALITPMIATAHPGHSADLTHSFLHFEHLFITLTIVFFIVINNLIKKYLEIKIDK